MFKFPNLRVGGFSTFLDNDLTYLHLAQDGFIMLSFIALTWDLLDIYQISSDLNPSRRFHEVSLNTLVLYSLALTTRLAEYYPFSYFSYNFASCAGFAVIFWIASGIWMYYNFRKEVSIASEQQDNARGGEEYLPLPPAIINTGRPVWFHVTVGITGVMAYLFNYSHLTLTPKLFLWAWSHYLDGVAMIPQMYTLVAAQGGLYTVSQTVWMGVNFMAVSKIFQLMDWVYLWMVADMLDVLAVVAAIFYLTAYGAFTVTVFIKSRVSKRSINSTGDAAVITVTESKQKSPFTATIAATSNTSYSY